MTDAAKSGPERIWLEPECCADPSVGRTWCKDNVWPLCDCDAQAEATEYVRADLVAAIRALPLPAPNLDAIRAEERRILSGLRDGSLVAVPREPTEAMLDRAGEVIVREFAESDWEEAKDMAEALNPRPIWDAMLAAAEPPR
jgi:hypothetical protein